jgi:hypothetical protein
LIKFSQIFCKTAVFIYFCLIGILLNVVGVYQTLKRSFVEVLGATALPVIFAFYLNCALNLNFWMKFDRFHPNLMPNL